jgi:hypothetical protein
MIRFIQVAACSTTMLVFLLGIPQQPMAQGLQEYLYQQQMRQQEEQQMQYEQYSRRYQAYWTWMQQLWAWEAQQQQDQQQQSQ